MNRYIASIRMENGRIIKRYMEAMSMPEAWMEANGFVSGNSRMEEVVDIERKGRIRQTDIPEGRYHGRRS